MTRKLSIVLFVCIGMLAVGIPLIAHHSFAATYDEEKSQTIEGELAAFAFRNPHSFVHGDVADASGQKTRGAVEWASGSSLNGQGITRDTAKFGDHLADAGHPGRNDEEPRMRMRRRTRAKGGCKWSGNFQ